MSIRNFQGCLMGLAVGDALGTTLEFNRPGSFNPIDDIVGGGPFALKAGYWTDDTSMALCLAESLIVNNCFDANDQIQRYLRWYHNGYMSSTGSCFDIGNATREALEHYSSSGNPFSGSTDPYSAGNGSIMRLAPVPLFFSSDPELAMHYCAESSRTTHGAEECIDACRFLGSLIIGAVFHEPKENLLEANYHPVKNYWDRYPLSDRIREVASGSYKKKNPPEIQNSGYVVKSLEAALWAFYHSSSFKEGALLAVNLGDDADTIGAIYGQLAGAFYGLEGIPQKWREIVHEKDLILDMGAKIYHGHLLLCNEKAKNA